jgi:DNA polymerase III gamma/tau subunit
MLLAQELRPKLWSEYHGSENYVKILHKSILTNKIPGALFISGGSGLGKTELATLYIKSILCLNRKDDEVEPCNNCAHCDLDPRTSGVENNVLWVQTGGGGGDTIVTQMNELIQEAYIPAQRFSLTKTPRKFLVVDELQSVPKDRISQLLFLSEVSKVSEENNVTFIFCTMDEGGINDNVLLALKSRCGAFYFRFKTPTLKDIKEFIESKFILDDDVINMIALSSNYSYRATLQTIEYCMECAPSFDNKSISSLLGFIDNDIRKRLWQLLESCNRQGLQNYRTFKTFWDTLEQTVNKDILFTQLEQDIELSLLSKPNESQLIALDALYISKVNKDISLTQSVRSLMGLKVIDYNIFT